MYPSSSFTKAEKAYYSDSAREKLMITNEDHDWKECGCDDCVITYNDWYREAGS